MKSLPKFISRGQKQTLAYITNVLINDREAQVSSLERLIPYDDAHYRAIFHADYFTLAEGESEPTKSQWNTLKKRMKRLNKNVFVFKMHGATRCGTGQCYYVDFGFLEPEISKNRTPGKGLRTE